MKSFLSFAAVLLAWSLLADAGNQLPQGRKPEAKPGKSGNAESTGKSKNPQEDKKDPSKKPKPPNQGGKAPSAPTRLIASPLSEFVVELQWRDNSTNETGFRLERSLDGKNFTQIASLLQGTTYYRDLNRFPNAQYFYRVRAVNLKGVSPYSTVARTETPKTACQLSVLLQPGYFLPQSEVNDAAGIAAGGYHHLILRTNGTVFLWQYSYRANLAYLSNVVAVAAGNWHSLILKSDGTVSSLGESYYGEADVPANLKGVVAIAAGEAHSLALKNDGTVVAWGNDEWWQARPPPDLNGVVAIAAGGMHSLALRSDGTVVGWGFNDALAAQPPPGLRDVVAISAGQSHSLALKRDGTVVSWGIHEEGLLPTDLTNVTSVVAGRRQSLALRADGTFAYWGSDYYSSIPPLNLRGVVALSSAYGSHAFLTTQPAPAMMPITRLIAANEVALNWQDYSDGTSSFEIKRGIGVPPLYLAPSNSISLGRVEAGSTQFVDATVVAGETYWYQVNAENNCEVTTGETYPDIKIAAPSEPPFIGSTDVSADTITIYWTSESIGATHYRVERAADEGGQPGTWTEIAMVPPEHNWYSGRYKDVGLRLQSTNWYRVQAINALGASPYSQPISATIKGPGIPRYLTAIIGSTNEARLTWETDYPYDLEGFRIERAADISGSPGGWVEIASVTNAITYTDATVAAGQSYWYRVRSFNALGDSDFSQPTTLSVVLTQPSLSAQVNSNLALLSIYYPSPQGHLPYAQVRFERAKDSPTETGKWKQITPVLLDNGWQFADSGLSANFTYRYRVKILTWLGWSEFSKPVGVSLLLPRPPHLVRAIVGNTNRIKLTWQPTPQNGYYFDHAGFHIERALETNGNVGQWKAIATVGLTNSYNYAFEDIVSRADSNRTFRYRIKTFNSVGESDYVESFPVQLVPPAAPELSASVYINQVFLNWNLNYLNTVGFRLERAPDLSGTPGAWSQIATFKPEVNVFRSYTDVLPPMESGYWYRVQAFNWLGDSEFSTPAFAQIQRPTAPRFVDAMVGNTNQLGLFWMQAPQEADLFLVERARRIGETQEPWSEAFAISRSAAYGPDFPFGYTGTDSNVLGQAEYAYRIRSSNIVGISSYSDVFIAQTPPPPPPEFLRSEYVTGRVILFWSPPSGHYDYGTITGYAVERSVDVNGSPSSWTGLGLSHDYSYSDNEPPPGTTCWYRIRSVNWIGGSDYTPSISVAIVPPPPPVLEDVTLGSTNQAKLTLYAAYPQDGLRIERAADVLGSPGAWEEIGVLWTNAGSVRFADTNVTAYATNWYRARAFHRAGLSDYSATLSLAAVPPPAPNYFDVTVAADQVRLFWYLNTRNEILGFKVERAADVGGAPGDWSQIALVPGEYNPSGWWSANYTNVVTTPNITYWYRVRAYNWIGDGPASTEKAATIRPPSPPQFLHARIGTTNQASIDWWPSLPTSEGGYLVERASDTNIATSDWTAIATIPAELEYFHDTNVVALTTNWYRVFAFNQLGTSSPSATVELRVIPPRTPEYVNAYRFANRVDAYWPDVTFSYGEVGGYEVQRASDIVGVPGAWQTISVQSNDTDVTDPNLWPNATYWYRVRAFNWIGNGNFSFPVSVTITPPAAPHSLYAYVEGTNTIKLRWYAGYPEDQDGFALERTTNTNAAWGLIATIPGTNTSWADYSDTNVIPNVIHYYRVRAFNLVGKSDYSDTASAIISLPSGILGEDAAAPFITSLVVTNDDVLITWTNSTGSSLVETAPSLTGPFVSIPESSISGAIGTIGTYLDKGTRSNAPARFYRIRAIR